MVRLTAATIVSDASFTTSVSGVFENFQRSCRRFDSLRYPPLSPKIFVHVIKAVETKLSCCLISQFVEVYPEMCGSLICFVTANVRGLGSIKLFAQLKRLEQSPVLAGGTLKTIAPLWQILQFCLLGSL